MGKTKIYQTKKLILAVPKPTLMKLRILHNIKKELNGIECIPLLRYYSIYPSNPTTGKVWFHDLGKTTTNIGIRYIIPIHKENGMIMVSYTDGYYAKKMQKRIEEKEDESYIQDSLEKLFPDEDIPNPILTKKYFWPCGEGLWKKHTNYQQISQHLLQPFHNQKLFIIGENYSLHQGWIEGALTTAHEIISL
jgi:hypothetical protein